ncbi:D-methionine transport system ATP-binding protein [Lachnospiraceae bacterium NLAE-zl-G231]|nr:D-methionine transport system ATP-binding protein [Lachnospiraceae bacterium NLAE-zl-G231]
MIRFENVSKTFRGNGKQVEAVKEVSLHIKKGEIFGIIGYSGAGKSTLVRCINLLERPDQGRIWIGDTEITILKGKSLRKQRRKIGMIFQQFHLFASRNVYENVAYPLKHQGLTGQEIKKRVEELLNLVGLEDKASAYPSQLSGGQKQRAAIARALANEPDILLCDEATSALDPKTTTAILRLLQEVNRKLGVTIVVITHEMQVVKEICGRVAVMEGGSVVEEGEVFDIFSNPHEKITGDFVNNASNLSRIYTYLEEKAEITRLNKGECILRLHYLHKNTSEALVSQISRDFSLNVNIIFGNIELIGENPIGGLVAIVSGSGENIRRAVDFLREKKVGVEVLADARVS